MKKFLFLFLILIFSNNVLAETKWITKKNSKTSKVKTLEQMYIDGLLSRSECIKAKKKILKNQSIPGCKKIKTDEDTVTYIAKKKKSTQAQEEAEKTKFDNEGYIKWKAQSGKDKFIYKVIHTDTNKIFEGRVRGSLSPETYLLAKEQAFLRCENSNEGKRNLNGCVVYNETQIAKITKKKPGKKKKKKKKVVEIYVPDDTEVDNIKPNIEIANSFTFKDPDYVLKGKVTDKGGSEKFYLFSQKGKGKKTRVKLKNGSFEIARFSFDNEEIKLFAIDEYRNETIKVVKVIIDVEEETEVVKTYAKPKPLIKGRKDNKRVAIIMGVESYENTVKALYANNDAEIFKNFAVRSLGINTSNIKILIGSEAKRNDALRALRKWLPKKITPNQSELFVFFSGHGYPSEDEGLHLIPQDGDPTMLEDTSLSHKSIINLIQATKPKSVTMFIDACYSGQSNTGEVLVAGLKPLGSLETDEDIPSNFNIFSSSESNRTSGTIKQAEHGIFSYYLMKGLSGEADVNKDRRITNKELFVYLQDTVSQEAFTQNREQNPKLKSDNLEQILIRY